MKFVDEFRDADIGRAVAMEILSLVEPGRHYKLMEVCGGHTHSIYKYGIDDLARDRQAHDRCSITRSSPFVNPGKRGYQATSDLVRGTI